MRLQTSPMVVSLPPPPPFISLCQSLSSSPMSLCTLPLILHQQKIYELYENSESLQENYLVYTCNSRVQHTHKYTQTEHRCPTETPNGIGNGLIQSLTKLLHDYPFTRSLSHEQTIGSLSCMGLFSYQHHHLLTQSVQLSMCVAVRACVCVCVCGPSHIFHTHHLLRSIRR